MINVVKKEIDMEESLKKRLEIICNFCNTTPTIINGSIRKIDKTNLNYIEPHRIIINNVMFLAFNYSNESKREESYMELSSIGVSPEDKNRGIGSKMIRYLYDISDKNRFKYIKLETDKDDNEGANYFYLKNGFVLDHSFRTPEGRNMNEYRLYFEGK